MLSMVFINVSFYGQVSSCTLSECLDLYTRTEILDINDAWYCGTCKTHVQATKKLVCVQSTSNLVKWCVSSFYARHHNCITKNVILILKAGLVSLLYGVFIFIYSYFHNYGVFIFIYSLCILIIVLQDIWKAPDILCLHLKRFQYTKYWREKLDTYGYVFQFYRLTVEISLVHITLLSQGGWFSNCRSWYVAVVFSVEPFTYCSSWLV